MIAVSIAVHRCHVVDDGKRERCSQDLAAGADELLHRGNALAGREVDDNQRPSPVAAAPVGATPLGTTASALVASKARLRS